MTKGFLRRAVAGLVLATAVLAASLLPVAAARAADDPLRIAISLSDIPNLWAAPDGGFEGVRFGGYTVFDSLVEWDLTSADKPSGLIPGLATSWTVDPQDHTRWTFKLRDATFHDGSPFNADAVVWNLDSVLNSKVPQYTPARAGLAGSRVATIASYAKIDDHTVSIITKFPDGFLPYELSTYFFASPARFAAVGNDWAKFAGDPSGTGPYVFGALQPKQSLTLTANESYWNKDRIPKTKTLVLLPIPDANTRVAALRSGQVDLVDTLPPDAIDSLKAAGFLITQNTYPHTWLWRLNFTKDSPFSDIRVRKAANLAIDRQSIVDFLNGSATPAQGFAPPNAPWFGHPGFQLKYDPDEARKLLAEAGYGPSHPVKLKIIISSSGGGQMVPLSMNELIQENLHDVGIDVTYDVRDFTAMINMLRQGAKTAGADAINVAMTMQDPPSGIAAYASNLAPPAGGNWGFYDNPDFDKAIAAARAEFDPVRQMAALAKVNEVLTDDAAALLVVHDTGPRALSPKLKGFVQAQNWYQDFTSIVKSE